MELLLPAPGLHMDSCSLANGRWPGDKWPFPSSAIPLLSIHPPQNRRNYLFSVFRCCCVGFRTQEAELFFFFLAEISQCLGSCCTELLKAARRASVCVLCIQGSPEVATDVNTCSKQPAQSRGFGLKGVVWV